MPKKSNTNRNKKSRSPQMRITVIPPTVLPEKKRQSEYPEGIYAVNQVKADVIYADPPWDINQKGHFGASQHYNLMTLDRIKAMPVSDLCKENAACFLWVTNGLLREGLDVLKAWGFSYRSPFYWVKSQLGLGQYLRNCSETLLLGVKGKMPVDFRAQPNWEFMPRQEHSKKPEEMYAIIERLYRDRQYLELFARKRPSNKDWLIWGDEAEGGSDIYIPGYPVPEYSGRLTFAKAGDEASDGATSADPQEEAPSAASDENDPYAGMESDVFTDADMEEAEK